MPSITQALAKLHANVENTKLSMFLNKYDDVVHNVLLHSLTVDELELLLELEYKFGTPTKLKPAIQDVLSYYEKVLHVRILHVATTKNKNIANIK